MNLYYFPGACSLAINIGLREAGLLFDLVEVDYRTRRLLDGSDYYKINAKGSVPALSLKDGTCLTEIIAIVYYMHKENEDARLLGSPGCEQKVMEWMSFLATEVHKSFSPLFRVDTPASFLPPGKHHLKKRLTIIERQLSQQPYLASATASAADYYLYTVCRWIPDVGICLNEFLNLSNHFRALEGMPSVQCALVSENLDRISASSH